jgi:pyrroline-5-carboxylate reductase
MVDQIGEQLSQSERPLIIDEADYLISTSTSSSSRPSSKIEVVRDIYESSLGTVILIGEEKMPQKLRKWERVYRRVLEWRQAEAATAQDVKHLAKLYCRGIEIGEDLLADLHRASGANAGHIVVNLDRIMKSAQNQGLDKISTKEFNANFFTGAPAIRQGGRA